MKVFAFSQAIRNIDHDSEVEKHTHHREASMVRSSVSLVGLIFGFSSAASAEPLNLICLGDGAANRVSQSYGQVHDNYGNSAWGTVTRPQSVDFSDQVSIELDGEKGRIRMPRAMLPPIRGGKDGWFAVEKVKYSDGEITGIVQVNFMNSPKLRIDRMQGRVAINGKAGDFSGVCQKYDPATAQRQF
jgi:hypothetical protein